MNYILLEGALLAQKKKEELKQLLTKIPTLSLATILVGDDEASKIYVNTKINACQEVGIETVAIFLSKNITQDELLNQIQQLNQNTNIHGILVQLPLPSHIDTGVILSSVDFKKDVDCFHPYHVGNLSTGVSTFAPATSLGIMMILETLKGTWDIESKNVVVIGASNIVGKPTAMLLLQKNATVTMLHKKSKNIKQFTKNADLIISATGQAHLITEDMVSDGVVIVDVGMNRINIDTGTKLVGDVDFNSVKNKCFAITPVPKGVGPMTVCALLYNLYYLYNNYHME